MRIIATVPLFILLMGSLGCAFSNRFSIDCRAGGDCGEIVGGVPSGSPATPSAGRMGMIGPGAVFSQSENFMGYGSMGWQGVGGGDQ